MKQCNFINVDGASLGFLVASWPAIAQSSPKILLIAKDRKQAESLIEDLRFFLASDGREIISFPEWDNLPFEAVSPQPHVSAERLRTLYIMSTAPRWLCITSATALSQKVISQESLLKEITPLREGDDITSLPALREILLRRGYQEAPRVEEVGEFAMRSEIIDLFPSATPMPIRLSSQAGIVTALSFFNPETQRSLGKAPPFTILPISESFPLRKMKSEEIIRYRQKLTERAKITGTPPSEVKRVLDELSKGESIPGDEWHIAWMESLTPFWSYVSSDVMVLTSDLEESLHHLEKHDEFTADREKRLMEDNHLIPTRDSYYQNKNTIDAWLKKNTTHYINALLTDSVLGSSVETVNLHSTTHVELTTKLTTTIGTGNAFAPLGQVIHRNRRLGYKVLCVVGSEVRAERLSRILLDLSIDTEQIDANDLSKWRSKNHGLSVAIARGHISAGVTLPDEKFVIIAEQEIFNEKSYRGGSRTRVTLKKLMSALSELIPGDYVVHIDYGIGRYSALTHLEIEGAEGDFLHIEYADSALYLPVQHIGKIQKFSAAEGCVPLMDKLSSKRWEKTKERVREAVLPLAGDLIKLYAMRSTVKGWQFDPFGGADERFADEFAYEETPDQLKAIEDTIGDMASQKPMDRLVCGDVGFGKTEVAIRAAFKATQHAKQVAIVAPTTLLVEQHYRSFLQRFKGFPIKIGIVSRFYKAANNLETLKKLSSGELDIIVGTHRLLQRDVQFKDLGLVVIDEEHRFGVKQKERLKSLKTQVDVLTLTATPIPRTLHMSLLGIRDISVIATPPSNRQVIRTYVAAYDEPLIRDALMREFERGGQSFFLHNRVETIAGTAHKLRELIPEARIQYAHGQMTETALEEIMLQFLKGEIDILVSTTIIESGIDIPNANTIIIDRADTFGLAQLYQIRGRVGRSNRQAYCYFLTPPSGKITVTAQQRLKALKSLDELGLGFNLAMRDLEIRGAGNLLGKEQSGQVLAVGFELYTKILQEAVHYLKGEQLELTESLDPEVKLGVSAFIPEYYIPDVSERLVTYQRLASAITEQELLELNDEMRDRFGPGGPEISALFEVMQFRVLCRKNLIEKLEIVGDRLNISFSPQAKVDITKTLALVKNSPRKYRLSKSNTFSIEIKEVSKLSAVYRELHSVLSKIAPPPLSQFKAKGLDSAAV